ncbi:MAG: hypothetical protein KF767_06655 [Bdellovibrionaceae bacterium]|nr:hypothetical protein [Pseudobdellovibrionaceae bacterium]
MKALLVSLLLMSAPLAHAQTEITKPLADFARDASARLQEFNVQSTDQADGIFIIRRQQSSTLLVSASEMKKLISSDVLCGSEALSLLELFEKKNELLQIKRIAFNQKSILLLLPAKSEATYPSLSISSSGELLAATRSQNPAANCGNW